MRRICGISYLRNNAVLYLIIFFMFSIWVALHTSSYIAVTYLMNNGYRPRSTTTDTHKKSDETPSWELEVSVPGHMENLYVIETELMALKVSHKKYLSKKGASQEINSRINYLINCVHKLKEKTAKNFKGESEDLSVKINKSLFALQNPKDCSKAKILVCILNNFYGLGGMLHHMALCFHLGIASGRTVVIHYLQGNKYNIVVNAQSRQCEVSNETILLSTSWDGLMEDLDTNVRVIKFYMAHAERDKNIFPLDAIPQDIADTVKSFHGLPIAWWQGQLLNFILKPSTRFDDILQQREDELSFVQPIVGVHVRRTDKHERYKHSYEEYMGVVEAWFDSFEQIQMLKYGKDVRVVRRIYLATEDYSVVTDLREQYEEYDIINNKDNTRRAFYKEDREGELAMEGVMVDIRMLSKCSHLVCDANSNVCRLAYELMQTIHIDASAKFTEVGLIYHSFPTLSSFRHSLDHANSRSEIKQTWATKIFRLTLEMSSIHKSMFLERITYVSPVSVINFKSEEDL